MVVAEDTITIPKDEYDDLMWSQRFLECLENAGVDNWEGYEHAQDEFRNG